jgi:glycerol-3-phosphate dehydrogenase subunit B
MDFLHTLPDDSPVYEPEKALADLARLDPTHPYSILGSAKTLALAREAEKSLASWGLEMEGSLASGNHLRLSPFGKLIPTWLSCKDAAYLPAKDGNAQWLWKKIAIMTVRNFLDFNPEIFASQLAAQGIETSQHDFTLPDLEILRENPSEFRAVNIARILDKDSNRPLVTEELKKAAKDADAVFLPACLGLNHPSFPKELSQETGKPVRLIPTLAPSMLGARMNNLLHRQFLKKGGVIMPKDRVAHYDLCESSKNSSDLSIQKLFTVNHGDIPIKGKQHVLATGSFFSKGLCSDISGMREAVFGLDLLNIPPERRDWSQADFFAPQPFSGFGVKSDSQMRAYLNGKAFSNLKVAGLVLGGFDPIRQGCGVGVALVSALAAAQAILS